MANTGTSNSFIIPKKPGTSNTFKIPAAKNATAVSNVFDISKAGRDYPLSESPNPTFNNQQ